MSEVVRCLCPHDHAGTKCGRNLGCPIHGWASADPLVDWRLTVEDRALLKVMRVTAEDSSDIQRVRQADEDRFRP